jgi:ATP-binding cassette subfamily B protein
MSSHNEKTPGEFIERIDGDVASLASFFSSLGVGMIRNVLFLIGVLVVLFTEHLWVFVGMAVYAAITIFILLQMRSIAVPHWKEARQAASDLFGFLEERLGGTVDIRSNGAVPFTLNQLYKHTGNRLDKELKGSVINIRLRYVNTALYSVGQIMSVLFGYYLYRDGTITIGTVILFVTYTDLLFHPLEQLTRQMEDLQKASASIGRIGELFGEAPSVVDGDGVTIPNGPISV